jgi:hypothetical protein
MALRNRGRILGRTADAFGVITEKAEASAVASDERVLFLT